MSLETREPMEIHAQPQSLLLGKLWLLQTFGILEPLQGVSLGPLESML